MNRGRVCLSGRGGALCLPREGAEDRSSVTKVSVDVSPKAGTSNGS